MSALGLYIVDAIVLQRRSPTQLARDHGISRSWIHRVLQRFREGGYAALEPRSRRPHSCTHQAAAEVQAEVLRLRAELLAAGHDRRPHRTLERQTPLAVFKARLKAGPAPHPAPVDDRLCRHKVDRFGKLTLRNLGRLRHIPVGVAHKNRKVRLLVACADLRVVTEDGELIRALTLDPTRDGRPSASPRAA